MEKHISSYKQAKLIKDLASMNKDLEEWIRETEKAEGDLAKKLERDFEKREKTPRGKCEICDAKEAKFICVKCGRAVCPSCYFNIVGLCTKCVSRDVVEKWKKSKRNWEKELGIEWID
ncbi:MAG: hypothetical protein J7J89_01535 [Thermoplasmata archaeon]|nr:hypothetical protein [Thermoplasmata archaeon]